MRILILAALACHVLWAQSGARDIRGIWQAAGKSTMVDPQSGKIPYRAAASPRERSTDPLLACFQPGVPRATMLPEPFQIFVNPDRIVIVYQHVHAYRVIFTDGRPHYDDGIEFYMGDSRGRWDGDTFVVDVTNFKPETWLDGEGTFHSNKLRVIERYTRTSPNTLRYEATIEDPEVFERPWTVRVDLARHTEPGFQLVEHECERDAQGVYRHPPQFLREIAR